MNTLQKPFSFTIYPVEWMPTPPLNIVLTANGFVTSALSFGLTATVTDANNNVTTLAGFSNQTGINTMVSAGMNSWTSGPAFPLTIAGTITTSSTSLDVYTTQQISLGQKLSNGGPACYQVSIFCNDSGVDEDWNDLVMNFQLFDDSTDTSSAE